MVKSHQMGKHCPAIIRHISVLVMGHLYQNDIPYNRHPDGPHSTNIYNISQQRRALAMQTRMITLDPSTPKGRESIQMADVQQIVSGKNI
jgi:hypothetical protein